MSEIQDPTYLANGCHTAQAMRQVHSSLVCTEGVAFGASGGGDLEVTQRGAGANMSVDVASGNAFIQGTQTGWQGMYHVSNDATENVTIVAADPTNDRIDLIVARVRDSQYAGVVDDWTLEAVSGTPAPSPVAPSVPDNSLVLAQVLVQNGVTSIVNADITDARTEYVLCGSPAAPAWADYTPTLTNGAIGSGGVLEGRFIHDEETNVVHFQVVMVFGSAASISGTLNVALPAPAELLGGVDNSVGSGHIVFDVGGTADYYFASARTNGSSNFVIVTTGGLVASGLPAGGPDAGDSILISGTYEAAA